MVCPHSKIVHYCWIYTYHNEQDPKCIKWGLGSRSVVWGLGNGRIYVSKSVHLKYGLLFITFSKPSLQLPPHPPPISPNLTSAYKGRVATWTKAVPQSYPLGSFLLSFQGSWGPPRTYCCPVMTEQHALLHWQLWWPITRCGYRALEMLLFILCK